jgi:hypothetical protein
METLLSGAVMCNDNIGAMAILEMGALLHRALFATVTFFDICNGNIFWQY